MQCLKCSNDVLPGKALCEACFQNHQSRFSEEAQAAYVRRAMNETYAAFHSDEGEPAGFWLRFFAVLVDYSICCLISLAILTLAKAGGLITRELASSLLPKGNPLFATLTAIGIVLAAHLFSGLVYTFYSTLFEASSWQGGFGKRLFRLKVTNLTGERISIPHALGRALARNTPFILGFVGAITLLLKLNALALVLAVGVAISTLIQYPMAAFTSMGQALHDKIAGTLVLKCGERLSIPGLILRIIFSLAVAILMVEFSPNNSDKKQEYRFFSGERRRAPELPSGNYSP